MNGENIWRVKWVTHNKLFPSPHDIKFPTQESALGFALTLVTSLREVTSIKAKVYKER